MPVQQITLYRSSLVLFAALLALSGCATVADNPEHSTKQQSQSPTVSSVTYLPENKSPELAAVRPGDRINLDETPWGERTVLTVTSHYFAASGKHCMRGQIESQTLQSQPINVCQYNDTAWGATKALLTGEQQGNAQ